MATETLISKTFLNVTQKLGLGIKLEHATSMMPGLRAHYASGTSSEDSVDQMQYLNGENNSA